MDARSGTKNCMPGKERPQYSDAVGFKPETSIEEGLQQFTDWYVEYYDIK